MHPDTHRFDPAAKSEGSSNDIASGFDRFELATEEDLREFEREIHGQLLYIDPRSGIVGSEVGNRGVESVDRIGDCGGRCGSPFNPAGEKSLFPTGAKANESGLGLRVAPPREGEACGLRRGVVAAANRCANIRR
jgi:hypothetical protein